MIGSTFAALLKHFFFRDFLTLSRILFVWIGHHIAYDVTVFFEGSNGDQTPSGVLETRRAVCEGYANLYRELGRRAGLDVWKVMVMMMMGLVA